MAKIKICGIRRREDVSFLNKLKPDYAGFILSPGYRRSITMKEARQLSQCLSKDIKKVGVFVNESVEAVNEYVRKGIIDLVQLHGEESPAYCAKIAAPVIKVFKCNEGFSPESIAEYDTDYFMFDTAAGSGRVFNWGLVPKTEKPVFLAGGLTAENVAGAIEAVHPFAVDISSGAETDGVKDYEKIKKILGVVRNV